ncbi:MAG: hypothetical protein NDJ19_04395 [Ramlibacter sp.]|nr:hypothetical protein [Ramlibacter sp.]
MRNYLLVAVLATLLAVAGMAAGETVPCPPKKAGQWYRFAKTDLYGKTIEQLTKIDSVEGERLFITQNGEALVTDRMHNWHKLGARVAAPKYYVVIDCPFSLGETRIYKDVDHDGDPMRKPLFGWTQESNARGTMTVTVAPEFESLTVKAGSFKVVKMVSENVYRARLKAERDRGISWDSTARVVSYYAPEIGIWVKSESTEVIPLPGGGGRYRDRLELIEYSIGD